ncbi:portal protein [Arenimonas alkanexedens]
MSATNFERCLQRGSALKSLRQPHEDVWRKCYDYTYPILGSGLQGNKIDAQQGLSRNASLLDGTGTEGARTLTSAIMQGLTPSSTLWALLDVGSETSEEERWLYDAAVAIWENIHNSNFDASAYEAVLDSVIAGWCVLYIDDDREQGGYVFEKWTLASCYCASTRTDGRIDTIYHYYQLPAVAVVREFGEETVSVETRKLAQDKPDTMVDLVHVIEPRALSAVGALRAKNLPFASLHGEVKAQKLLRESGYHEFPCVVPRWLRIPESAYGVGPVYDALPDMQELNDTKFMQKASMELAIAGMWIAEDDGVLNARSVKVGPRKIIVANSVDSMKPLLTGADFNVGFTAEERLQAAVRRRLMTDELTPQDGPVRSATEIYQNMQMLRQKLGPVYGRYQAEYLRPLIDRCFGLAYRAGALGTPPQSLGNRTFTAKYISPMARAQKLEEVQAVDTFLQGVLVAAESSPETAAEMLDNIDLDAAMQFKGEALGVPTAIRRKPDDIAKRRQGRAEAAQAAQQQEQAGAMQMEAVKGATKQQGVAR